MGYSPPFQDDEKKSSCHLYALRVQNVSEKERDKIIELISKDGVAVNVHFQPLPLLSLFKEKGFNINNYPVAFDNYKREISLPIYPQLNDEQLLYIVNTVTNAVETVI